MQLLSDRNRTEDQSIPFIDQVMALQKAHRGQRDEDTKVIENLESLCEERKLTVIELKEQLDVSRGELEVSKTSITALNKEIRTLRTTSDESEMDAQMMTVALRECEVKAKTMTVALRESEVKAETMTVALRESERNATTLSSSFHEMESLHFSLIEEHVAMIAYLQNEVELLQLASNSSSNIGSSVSVEACSEEDMTSSLSKLNVNVGMHSHSQSLSRKKDDENTYQKDILSLPLSQGLGLPSGPNDQNTRATGKEFSHMQSEMERFRSARGEAKVSLSKIAGRVAIVKDQLHEKVERLSYCNRIFLLFLPLLLLSFCYFFFLSSNMDI